ncbi:MAG: triose-phosphate isomerase [Phycisphaerales bacterium]|jgi:triosephosphate isomerase|nr:triose-phosphate isomerase [Phycisphaerales bacterium]
MTQRTPIVGGNWKMNSNHRTAAELTRELAGGLERVGGVDVFIAPPFPYLLLVGAILRERGSRVALAAQDVYFEPDGAFTGEVSIAMLQDCNVRCVIVGHSERRHVLGEHNETINRKLRAVLDAGLQGVLCVGETLGQREAGRTDDVNRMQLQECLAGVDAEHAERLVVAYEPVWAIGTGRTATPEDAQDAHHKIRTVLGGLFDAHVASRIRIQYGGSVKGSNALGLFAQGDIDGGLIGGASLKSAEFVQICQAAAQAARAD